MQGNPAGAPESRNGWGEAGGRCPASGGTGRGGAGARCGQEREAEAAPPGSPTTARASAKRARRPGRLPARNGPQRASADSGQAGAHLLVHLFLDTHLYWKRARTSA